MISVRHDLGEEGAPSSDPTGLRAPYSISTNAARLTKPLIASFWSPNSPNTPNDENELKIAYPSDREKEKDRDVTQGRGAGT